MPRHLLHALAAAALLGAMAAAGAVQAAPTAPAFSNGGGQFWVAFDPNGRDLGNVQFLSKRIFLVNTSNQPNAYTIYDEPSHKTICTGTLPPGQMNVCGTQPGPAVYNDYLQVIAAQSLLVGGTSDTAYMNYTQQSGANGLADTSHGLIISVPLIWQQGCPPRAGSGCPDGATTAINQNGATVDRVEQPLR